jgi:hypothetical protein
VHKRIRWSRILTAAGLVLMLLGLLDPLEGSFVILAGSVFLAVGSLLAATRYRKLILWSLAIVALGIGAMWAVSSVGGFGGSSGRSYWWALVLLPYPAGWIMGVIGGIRELREAWKAPSHLGPPPDTGA